MAAGDIAGNLAAVRARIAAALERAGRPPDAARLVAVSKTFPPDAILEAYRAGQRDFGENRVQEFEGKRPALELEGAVWRLIGHLQSNKTARAAQLFHAIDSVDSVALAERLDRAATRRIEVLIEVKLSEEATKSGAAEGDVQAIADAIRRMKNLDLRGLMTIPPWSTDAEVARPYFRRLREIGRRLGTPELSMGMTNDFEAAIEEGATMVRVGTAIFGKRTPPPPE